MLKFVRNSFSCLFLCLLATASEAKEATVGNGLVCDTKEQVERIVQAELPRTEILTINEEAGYAVCDVVTVAFIIEEAYPHIMDAAGNEHFVARITVIGVEVVPGKITPTPPLEVYTTFKAQTNTPVPQGVQA